MYLLYNTKEECRIDIDKIYATMVQETSCYHGGMMYNHITNQEEFVLMLDEEELTSDKYPVYGKSKGKTNHKSGFTLAYAQPQEDVNGKWFIPEPKQEYRFGLIGELVESVEFKVSETI